MPEVRSYTGLSDSNLIRLLYTEGDRLSRPAVDELVRRGVPVATVLVALIDDESNWPVELPRGWAPVHAVHVLASMQPPGALDALLRALEKADQYDVDGVTDPMPSMLASFGPRALDRLARHAADPAGRKWVRIPVLEALHHLAAEHASTRERVAEILRGIASSPAEPKEIRQWAAMELLPFARPEDRDLLLSLAGGGGFDILYVREDVDRALAGRGLARKADFDWLSGYPDNPPPDRDILDDLFDPDADPWITSGSP